MKSVEIRQQRAKDIHDARHILDDAEQNNGGVLTAEKQAEYEAFVNAAEEKRQRIERLENLEKLEDGLMQVRERVSRPEHVVEATRNDDQKTVEKRHWNNFLAYGAPEYRGLVADTAASGGYLVAPLEFNAELIKTLDELVPIRSISSKKTLERALALGTPSYTKMANASWTTEVNVASADTTAATGRRDLTPRKLSKLIKVSNKLLQFGTLDPQSVVLEDMARVFAETEENAYTVGTGSGDNMPLGVFTASASGIPTSRDYATGNTTTAIVADNLIGALYQLKDGHRRKASWILHTDAMLQIATLKDDNGQYLWRVGLSADNPDTILGRPAYTSSFAPNTFSAGNYVYVVGNFEYYWICEVPSAGEVKRLDELYAGTDETGFIGRRYIDAAPVLAEAFVRGQLAAS